MESAELNGAPDLAELDVDSDNESVNEVSDVVTSSGQRKGARKHIADAFFNSQGEALLKAAVERKDPHHGSYDHVSLKALMAEAESKRIVANPRSYQLELFEIAKARNTIAVLDTGSGKTLIAVLLLRFVLDRELERRAAGAKPKLAFFLVDKVALVFQQFGVLLSNLDHSIQHLCGAMNLELWAKQTWERYTGENMVIVCTAEVLAHSFWHGYISMADINLIIFDEAHHAKKNHSYAQIMREHYMPLKEELRPRVFGMTASPVDIEDEGDEVDIMNVIYDLETVLDAKIATPRRTLELNESFIVKPKEQNIYFDPGLHPYHSALYSTLQDECGGFDVMNGLLTQSKAIARHLGQWCGDYFWTFSLTEETIQRHEDALSSRVSRKRAATRVNDKQLDTLQRANDLVKELNLGRPVMKTPSVSPKILALYSVLEKHFEMPTDARCLVFVEMRTTARLLASVFQNTDLKFLYADFIVGCNASTVHGFSNSVKKQVSTLMKFRRGQLNCLFATNVAEEGLDIPDCNIIIRFDMVKTTIQYIQSRGRARRHNSVFYHLVERENQQQIDTLSRIKRSDDAIKHLCNILPEDRVIQDDGHAIDDILERDQRYRHYKDKKTGAVLSYSNSIQILANFVHKIPHDPDETYIPTYYTTKRGERFVCEVVLPPSAPVATAIGQRYSTKAAARASAAFEACVQLRKLKWLTEHLVPAYVKKLHALSNARIALDGKKKNRYDMLLKPNLWALGRDLLPEQVFLSVIRIKGRWDRALQPLGLLTRHRLPALPEFNVFRLDGTAVAVELVLLTNPIFIAGNSSILDHATQFTLTILRDVFNKKYEFNPARMSYWLVPLAADVRQALNNNDEIKTPTAQCIDQSSIACLQYDGPRKKFNPESDSVAEFVPGSYLVDNWAGAKRYFTKRVEPSLGPESPMPDGVKGGKKKAPRSVIDFTVNLWRKSKAQLESKWDLQQPVVEVELMSHRLNILAPPTDKEKAVESLAYVCLQPLDISLLNGEVVGMAYLFPSIIHRIEDYLIAVELCKQINIDVSPRLALEAITKDSDNSEDVNEEQVNFQSGMGPNYERLEFLGDTFLKMATTITVYILNQNHEACDLHCDRMVFSSNVYLFSTAVERGFPKYIRTKAFSRRTWYPEGLLLLEGKNATKRVDDEIVVKPLEEQQIKEDNILNEKTIADVSEALIGAALVAKYTDGYADPSQFDNAVTAITEIVGNPSHDMRRWTDYFSKYESPSWLQTEPTAAQRILVDKVALLDNYRFKHPQLLRSALMHPSMPRMMEGVPSYERLEFLGDGLLDMAHVSHLFYKNPTKDPGWLTEHKMAMVSNQFCAALAVKMGLHEHMRYASTSIASQIETYVSDIREAEKTAKGAVDYWTTVPEGPKYLADILEAYVGAMFIDSGFCYAQVQRFWDDHILPFFKDMRQYDSFASSHPIRRLHYLMEKSFGCREFSVMAKELQSPDGSSSITSAVVIVHSIPAFHSEAKTGRVAKIGAASQAVQDLSGLAPASFRERFSCDCQQRGGEAATNLAIDEVGTAV